MACVIRTIRRPGCGPNRKFVQTFRATLTQSANVARPIGIAEWDHKDPNEETQMKDERVGFRFGDQTGPECSAVLVATTGRS